MPAVYPAAPTSDKIDDLGHRVPLRDGNPSVALYAERDLLHRVVDALDFGVLVLSADLRTPIYANVAAAALANEIPRPLADAIHDYVLSRRNAPRLPPALRVSWNDEPHYLRVVASAGTPPVEIVFLRREVRRDPEVMRILEQRFGVTRREYQVVAALRAGKTNRQIAAELGLAEGTVARHIHRLFQRTRVRNRTELVHLVDTLVNRSI